jgi:hypothetical protein
MVRYAIALSEAMPARALRTLRIYVSFQESNIILIVDPCCYQTYFNGEQNRIILFFKRSYSLFVKVN